MKKLLFAIAVLAVTFTSCKKKPKEEEVKDPFKLEYSNLTTEQQKQSVETEGIAFVQELDALPEQKFIGAISHLSGLNLTINSGSLATAFAVSSSAKNKDIKGIFKATTSFDGEKLSDSYGIYTWNFETEDWDETPSTTKLEIKYPSDETKTTNNAVFSFNYVASTIKTSNDGELPSSVSSVLKIDDKEELKLTSTYAYNSSGIPTKVDIDLLLGAFSFKTNVDNNGSNFTSAMSFLKGTEVLISFKTAVNGNLNLDANSDEDIVNDANATFEVMNIKLAGKVDVKALQNAVNASSELSDSLQNVKQAEAWGKYAAFVAINKKDNVIMARAEFVPISHNYCYTYWTDNAPYEVCEKEYILEPRLMFKDDSKVSFDSFIDSGFSELRDELESFGEKFK